MSNLHQLLTLPQRPVSKDYYLPALTNYLHSGIPATYTLEQAAAFENDEEVTDEDSNTTPLHILARSLPRSDALDQEETEAVLSMFDTLFEYGAGWNFLDYEQKSIGDLLLERGYGRDNALYQRVVDAGVSAELLLRKINGGDVEFLEVDENGNIVVDQETQSPAEQELETEEAQDPDATAADQTTYLNTKLEYTDDALVTKDNRDGVMMDWETDIMKLARDSLFKTNKSDALVLNIGFGMGIIDTFIQESHPAKHYICEAHPDVLSRMRQDGWYDKPNVVVLEGRWQDSLNRLLDEGTVFFDGIYYDTFSEHYQDMLDLYDVVVGLLKPEGVFSFFNGLGADRTICYDVYRRIVELDVANYGMACTYNTVPLETLPNWEKVKRSYFNCDHYYHPEISFV